MELLFGSFFLFIFLGVPISFGMFASSALYLIVNDVSLVSLVQRVSSGVSSFPLLAAPLFIMAGSIMNAAGITERIFAFCSAMVGHYKGGLGYVNVLSSMIMSGKSGTAVADAAGLGQVVHKAMKDAGYDERFSLAVTGASATLAPILPPSVPGVMIGVIGGVSIGRIFVGGIIPGIIMSALMMILVGVISKMRNYPSEPRVSWSGRWKAFKSAFFSLLVPVVLIGGIVFGINTPTEGGALAVTLAVILGFAYRELNLRKLYDVIVQSCGITLSVMFIIGSGAIFGWILAIEQIPQMTAAWFMSYVESPLMAMLLINILLLTVGMFMDTMAAISILTPILMPIVLSFGIDPVQFTIIMVLNLMIGLLTPPVGVILFIMSSFSGVPVGKLAIAVLPFLFALLFALAIFTLVPATVTWLPNLVFG